MQHTPSVKAANLSDHSKDATAPDEPELRVALFTGNYNYIKDGVALTLNRLVAFLLRRGIPVLIFTPTGKTPAFESVGEIVSLPSIPVPMRSEYRISTGFPRAARERLKAFGPTLIHIAVPDIAGYQALKLGMTWGIPVVASYHTRYDTYLRFYGLGFLEKMGQRYLGWFYDKVRRVYPPSQSMAELIGENGRSDHVQIWARGVDSDLFSPAKRNMAWRHSLKIADDSIVITFVGRLVKEKNTGIVVRVLNSLKQKGLRITPMIVGDGPELSAMKAGLADGIFPGFLHGEDLARAYASSDIFFFPSESETFGNVTLEAMASGLPAVNAVASGSNSLVADGETGFLVSARDEASLAARIEALISDATLRQRMGARARAQALEFSWDEILTRLLESYRQVLREAASEAGEVQPTPRDMT